MKCDSCKFQIVVEPFTKYDKVCSKGHWSGDDSENYEPEFNENLWDNCKDFEDNEKEIDYKPINSNDISSMFDEIFLEGTCKCGEFVNEDQERCENCNQKLDWK